MDGVIGVFDGDFFVIRRNNTAVCRFLFPLVSSFPIIFMLSNCIASDAKKQHLRRGFVPLAMHLMVIV